MTLLRSDRAAAVLLLVAAALGLIAANSPLAAPLDDVKHAHLAVPFLGIDLSIGHWISDGLLAVFFLVAAIELRHELTRGQLNSVAKALHPAIAALGGIVVPIAVYLLIAGGSGYEQGWPIPTATDIAFALGVLAVFGRGLPGRLRVFLLALAILDDIVAILIIAVFFTTEPDLLLLLLAAVGVVAVGLLARLRERSGSTPFRVAALLLLIVLGILVWVAVLGSGVHATIAGVALGLALPNRSGHTLRHRLEPAVNGGVLPLFAFSAAFVAIPAVSLGELSAPFWAILVALPLGKLIGIGLGGWLGGMLAPPAQRTPLGAELLLAAGALGGIGFTVSLLMNELAFADAPGIAAEGTLAVLTGSMISLVLSGVLVSRLARKHRRAAAVDAATATATEARTAPSSDGEPRASTAPDSDWT